MTNPNSNWRWAIGYEDLYAVSDHAEVYSVRSSRLLKTVPNRDGYLVVALPNPIRTRRLQYVHVLMLEAFVGPRPPGMWGLHYDDEKSNTVLSNLYWGTPSRNQHDRVRNGNHWQANKTHCKNDHEFTPENTVTRSDGGRDCLQCRRDNGRERSRRYRERKARNGCADIQG
jgi:hypothetical protein